MSRNALGMTSDMCSGTPMREHSAGEPRETTRVIDALLSHSQKAIDLRDATLRMGRALKAIPREVQNRWYGFTRTDCRYPTGHLMGSWPEVARAFAKHGAPLADVMSPAYEVASQLKREVYHKSLPSLEIIEQEEAEVVCKIQKAEIKHDLRSLKEAAREEMIVAELLEEVADR